MFYRQIAREILISVCTTAEHKFPYSKAVDNISKKISVFSRRFSFGEEEEEKGEEGSEAQVSEMNCFCVLENLIKHEFIVRGAIISYSYKNGTKWSFFMHAETKEFNNKLLLNHDIIPRLHLE